MGLPGVARLLDLPMELCGALAARLRAAGLREGATAPYAMSGENMPERMRAPLRNWHLRRKRTPLTLAARMFMFMDPIDRAGAVEVLGELLPALVEHGLVVERDGGLVCPFLLNLVNELLVFCDDLAEGGDAVMGAGETTADLIRAAYPRTRHRSALDVGCGAGTAALLLAAQVDRAVGVDINPRAIVLAQFNARLNAIHNVEFRAGDLFAPVAGERFDLIVSQPAFVSAPDDAKQITFLHGGRRGDEMTMRILGELQPHLAEGGRAVILHDHPTVGDEPPVARLRPAIPAAMNLLLLVSTPKDLDAYCAFYAAGRHRTLGPEFERDAVMHREHLARLGVEALQFIFVVIDNAGAERPWTAAIETRSFAEVDVTSAQIDRLLASQRLLFGDDAGILRATLRPVEGMTFVDEGSRLVARLPARALVPEVTCSTDAVGLLSTFGDGITVEAAVSAFAAQVNAAPDALRPQIVPAVRQALAAGLLEVP